MQLNRQIIEEYNVDGPRYTSYPTANVWTTDFDAASYTEALAKVKGTSNALSLYIHIPFCEKRCLYCACNVTIRKANPKVADEYIAYLGKELDLIASTFGERVPLKQVHLGGGTPTFLNDSQLDELWRLLNQYFDLSTVLEQSIEVDPRTVDAQRIRQLAVMGFNRISFGVQDFNETVQDEIGRHQSIESVESLVRAARDSGIHSINLDLIYGLPKQDAEGFMQTIEAVARIQPDRIALYSFAYVPWLHPHQKIMDAESFPDANTKVDLFLMARAHFLSHGYDAIAMDHFALQDDELSIAYKEKRLKRNFMGYTTLSTPEYLGIGVSSIGYVSDCFSQNTKDLKDYYRRLDHGELPVDKGLALSNDDSIVQWVIQRLMCQFVLDKDAFEAQFGVEFDEYFVSKLAELKVHEDSGLIKMDASKIVVTELGQLFVRNVCMSLDQYFTPKENQFSKTV